MQCAARCSTAALCLGGGRATGFVRSAKSVNTIQIYDPGHSHGGRHTWLPVGGARHRARRHGLRVALRHSRENVRREPRFATLASCSSFSPARSMRDEYRIGYSRPGGSQWISAGVHGSDGRGRTLGSGTGLLRPVGRAATRHTLRYHWERDKGRTRTITTTQHYTAATPIRVQTLRGWCFVT